MKKVLNKWQVIWEFHRDFYSTDPFAYTARIGIIKIISYPKEGNVLTKESYKGFVLNWMYWFPWSKS